MEPERPIEKLLRAFAKKRRDQAGGHFELHAATRNLLQSEVSRQVRATQKAESSASFFRFWPRLAYGFGLFAVLGVMIYFFWLSPTGEPTTVNLAQNSISQSEMASPVIPPASSSLAPESGNTRLDAKLQEFSAAPSPAPFSEREKDVSRAAPATPPMAANRVAPAARPTALSTLAANEPATAGALADEQSKLSARALASTAVSKAPAMETVPTKAKAEVRNSEILVASRDRKQLTDKVMTLTASYRGTFVTQMRSRDAGSIGGSVEQPRTPAVLTSFRMDRTGDEIKITDSDGSIYQGRVVTLQDSLRRSFGLAATNAIPGASPGPNALGVDAVGQPASFSVSGSNVTLKTLVVFNGTFSPAQPVKYFATTANKTGGGGGAPAAAKRAISAPATSSIPGITGKIKVGADNQREIPIEATPTGP